MTDAPQKIGIVGLGPVGAALATRLMRAGHQLYVYTRGRVPPAIAESRATQCTTARGVAQRADIVFTLIADSDSADAETLLFGDAGVARALTPDKTVVELSAAPASLAPPRLAERIDALACDVVDAVVSAGDPQAPRAELTIDVVGSDAALARVLPLLQLMGRTVTRAEVSLRAAGA